MLSNRLRAIVGAMALLFWAIPAVADVCFLPNSNCGLSGPEEKGPVPVPDDDKNKCPADYSKDCPRINTTLQKYDKKDGCCRAVCRYESSSDCVAKSSTNYCELDSQTQCYKQAIAPVTCVGYNDTAEKAEDPNCDCEPCEDTTTNTTRYKCECVEPTPETCKSYGESLTPPQIYDTESSLVCGSNQKKQSINKIRNDKMCYQCVNKTCEDYGKKDKGQCVNGFREVDDAAHPGCVECVPQQVENNEICFKLNYTCNGKICSNSDTNFKKFMYLIDKGGLSAQYNGDSDMELKDGLYCVSKERLADNVGYLEPKDLITFYFNPDYDEAAKTDDYYEKESNRYIFKKNNSRASFKTGVSLFSYENELYYKKDLVGTEIYDACIKGLDDDNNGETDIEAKFLSCLVGKGYAKVPSTTININIDLWRLAGDPKCRYFTATCPKLDKNGGNAGYCIDQISVKVTDSAEKSRINNSFDYRRTSTVTEDPFDNRPSSTTFGFSTKADVDGENVTFSICGPKYNPLEDWDTVSITVFSNIYSDSEGKGGYLYDEETSCASNSRSSIYGNMCVWKEYIYQLDEDTKEAKFMPFIKYDFAVESTTVDLADTSKYGAWIGSCKVSLTTNKKPTKSIEEKIEEKRVELSLNFTNTKCGSNCTPIEYTPKFEKFSTLFDGGVYYGYNSFKASYEYDTAKANHICYAQAQGAITCEPTAVCKIYDGGIKLKPGYNYEDGYYYIINGLSTR